MLISEPRPMPPRSETTVRPGTSRRRRARTLQCRVRPQPTPSVWPGASRSDSQEPSATPRVAGRCAGVVRGRHHHRLPQAEPPLQRPLQGDAGGQPAVDLDLHQPGLAADLQVAHHLDPADRQPLGDLGLGQALDIVEPGDAGAALLVGRQQVEHGRERRLLLVRDGADRCRGHPSPAAKPASVPAWAARSRKP